MISTWQFITPPNGINMSADLMPLRQSGDETRYGIDTAWLWEVLSVWMELQGRASAQSRSMSIHPTASETNAIRTLATNIKAYQLSPNGTAQPIFDTAIQAAAFDAISDLASIKVAFGAVPADVASGDAVDNAHISDVFAWMQDVGCVHFAQSYTPAISSWVMDDDTTEGNPISFSPYPPTSEMLYLWQWNYVDWTGGRLDYLTGGGKRRQIASDFTITATLSNAKSYWFKSAMIFLKVGSSRNSTTAYVPLDTPTITQSGSNVQIAATCSAASVAQDAMTALSVSEVPYKSGISGSGDGGYDYFSITAGTGLVCFLEFADDYRYPTPQS